MTTQQTNQAQPLFSLGQIAATPGALEALANISVSPRALLSRHQYGDWGELDEADKQLLNIGERIFSAYQLDTLRFWVITEADRSATTILLPEEY